MQEKVAAGWFQGSGRERERERGHGVHILVLEYVYTCTSTHESAGSTEQHVPLGIDDCLGLASALPTSILISDHVVCWCATTRLLSTATPTALAREALLFCDFARN